MTTNEKIGGMLLGLAAGDALGVPVEFMSREQVQRDPVESMRGYGTHHQPPGTWSDDASLTFCLADALVAGEEALLSRLSTNMIGWLNNGLWAAHGHVFDVGITTSKAIRRLEQGVTPEQAGGQSEYDNGNGSLMRILPLLLLVLNKPIEDRFEWARRVSGLTHGHIRSVMACFYYLELARQIWQGVNTYDAYFAANEVVHSFWVSSSIDEKEQQVFERLLNGRLADLPEESIRSDGYVLETLEASVWCWLTTGTYADAVIRAVNLGADTDTTGAVTGGLAGLQYGAEGIPADWVNTLARLSDIQTLITRLAT